MNKKLLFASSIIVPVFALGGFWVYQASRFDDSIKQQVILMQDSLKAQGISFTYDGIQVSKLSFRAHLINPKITGVLPDFSETVKGLKGTAFVKGEIVACFSPFANTIAFKQIGESHLKTEGPIELDVSFPQTSNSNLVIKRKEYDFFGKNPFLSFKNMEEIHSDVHAGSILMNGQRFLEVKDGHTDISLKPKGNDMEVSLQSGIQKMKFFNVEKALKGTLEGLDNLNAKVSAELATYESLGEQDQKLSLSFHVKDIESYIENLTKLILQPESPEESDSKFVENMNNLFPEGIRFDVTEFSSLNAVYQSSMKANLERTKDQYLLSISGDCKMGDEWKNYWKNCEKKYFQDVSEIGISPETMSIIKGNNFFTDIMPQLQTFGKMYFSVNLEAPTTIALGTGKAAFQFKSDLYDLGAKGSLADGGASIHINTRNASALTGDLENYVIRIADKFSATSSQEVTNVKNYLKGGVLVLNKVLEPQGAAEQQVEIKVNPTGINVGKYDMAELLTLFNGAIAPSEPPKEDVKTPAGALPLQNPSS